MPFFSYLICLSCVLKNRSILNSEDTFIYAEPKLLVPQLNQNLPVVGWGKWRTSPSRGWILFAAPILSRQPTAAEQNSRRHSEPPNSPSPCQILDTPVFPTSPYVALSPPTRPGSAPSTRWSLGAGSLRRCPRRTSCLMCTCQLSNTDGSFAPSVVFLITQTNFSWSRRLQDLC